MNQKSGLDFEVYVQAIFEDREIPVFETPTTNDFGADLVLYRNGKVAVIQCKYHSAPIGIHAVQEVVGAIKHYQADAGIVISNQPFTRQAVALALSNHVLLMTGSGSRRLQRGYWMRFPISTISCTALAMEPRFRRKSQEPIR